MTKILLILGGILGVGVIAAGIWMFLLTTGTTAVQMQTQDGNPFGEVGTRTDTPGGATAPPTPRETITTSDTAEGVRQLTTRKVAGAVLVQNDAGDVIRFAEAGTGHLYEIPLTGGGETRISNTTIPGALRAEWSPSGTRVAITRERDRSLETQVGSIVRGDDGVDSFVGDVLPADADSIGFNESGDTLYYTLADAVGTRGVARDLKTGKETTRFTTPLRDITVSWEPSPLIVTKASGKLSGYAYTGTMERVSNPGLALRAIEDSDGFAFGSVSGDSLTGWLLGTSTVPLSKGIIPDKCVFSGPQLVCAIPKDHAEEYPEGWYQGRVTFNDTFWVFNRSTGVGSELTDPLISARRSLDVLSFEPSESMTRLPFINKTDRSLWLLTI